jgi:hypothetical protein
MPYPAIPCPKCSRLLSPSGELTIDGQAFPVYQCDDCVVPRDVFGEMMDLPFTFYIDEGGNPVDATEPD